MAPDLHFRRAGNFLLFFNAPEWLLYRLLREALIRAGIGGQGCGHGQGQGGHGLPDAVLQIQKGCVPGGNLLGSGRARRLRAMLRLHRRQRARRPVPDLARRQTRDQRRDPSPRDARVQQMLLTLRLEHLRFRQTRHTGPVIGQRRGQRETRAPGPGITAARPVAAIAIVGGGARQNAVALQSALDVAPLARAQTHFVGHVALAPPVQRRQRPARPGRALRRIGNVAPDRDLALGGPQQPQTGRDRGHGGRFGDALGQGKMLLRAGNEALDIVGAGGIIAHRGRGGQAGHGGSFRGRSATFLRTTALTTRKMQIRA